MLSRTAVLILLVVACGARGAAPADDDRRQIAALIDEVNATARDAWVARDAARLLPGDAAEVVVHRPDGTSLTRGDLRRDLQRRMEMTAEVEQMIEQVERIDLDGDRATAFSRQRFARVVALPDGTKRRRISTVLHKRTLEKRDRTWRVVGSIEELEPKAWWADEAPP